MSKEFLLRSEAVVPAWAECNPFGSDAGDLRPFQSLRVPGLVG